MQIAYRSAPASSTVPREGAYSPTNNFKEKSGLAGAIITDEADAFAGLDMPGGIFHNYSCAKFECYVL